MAYFLPHAGTIGSTTGHEAAIEATTKDEGEKITDLRVLWGPDICRLEYLLHLVETGRVKDSYLARPSS